MLVAHLSQRVLASEGFVTLGTVEGPPRGLVESARAEIALENPEHDWGQPLGSQVRKGALEEHSSIASPPAARLDVDREHFARVGSEFGGSSRAEATEAHGGPALLGPALDHDEPRRVLPNGPFESNSAVGLIHAGQRGGRNQVAIGVVPGCDVDPSQGLQVRGQGNSAAEGDHPLSLARPSRARRPAPALFVAPPELCATLPGLLEALARHLQTQFAVACAFAGPLWAKGPRFVAGGLGHGAESELG